MAESTNAVEVAEVSTDVAQGHAPAASAPAVAAPRTMTVDVLRHKLALWQRNASLLLIYFTVFIDFIGITLLSPGLRFMVDPLHPEAFTDLRLSPECAGLGNATAGNLTNPHSCERTSISVGSAISLMMFSYGIGQLISGPILGCLSDRFGPRNVLIFSTVGTSAAFAAQGCIWSFYPHVAVRFVGGLFAGSRPVCQAYIAASVPRHERAAKIGYLALSVMAALQFGPVLGGSLSMVNLRLPLFMAAGMAALCAVLLALYLTNPPARAAGAPAKQADRAATRLADQRVTKALLCVLAGGGMLTVMSFQVVLPIRLADEYGLSPNEIGLMQWGDGLCLLVGNQLYDHARPRPSQIRCASCLPSPPS